MAKVEQSKLQTIQNQAISEGPQKAKKKKSFAGEGMNAAVVGSAFDLAKSQKVTSTSAQATNLSAGGGATKLSPQMMEAASGFARSLDLTNPETTMNRWEGLISGLASGTEALDINALVQQVLRESYLETNKDLQFYADKVKYYNEVKENIRNELTSVRAQYAEIMKANPNAGTDDVIAADGIQAMSVPAFPETAMVADESAPKATTKREIEAYIDSLEQKLSSVGDDAQLANIDLQNKLQQQQQTLQTMSNTSKMLHDTAMAVVRKIG